MALDTHCCMKYVVPRYFSEAVTAAGFDVVACDGVWARCQATLNVETTLPKQMLFRKAAIR